MPSQTRPTSSLPLTAFCPLFFLNSPSGSVCAAHILLGVGLRDLPMANGPTRDHILKQTDSAISYQQCLS